MCNDNRTRLNYLQVNKENVDAYIGGPGHCLGPCAFKDNGDVNWAEDKNNSNSTVNCWL
jgi:hypothetical protein